MARAGVAPGEPTATLQARSVPTPHRSARQGLAAFGVYLAGSLVLYAVPVLSRFGHVFVGAGRGDARFYVWCLVWWPHALGAGLDPFTPHVIWAPQGLDMAWATGLPGPALALAPVTLAFGPVVASNVAAVIGPPLAGWAGYLLCRRAADQFWPAFAGGWLIGFSTYMVSQMRGHLNLSLVFPVLLAAYLVVRHVQGELTDRRFTLLLALVLVAEFSISTEVFATMTVFGAGAIAGLWWQVPPLRGQLRRTAIRIAVGYTAAGAMLAPYLWYVLVGVPTGPIRPTMSGRVGEDLLTLLVPRETTLVGGSTFHVLTRHLEPNLSEDGGYMGLALLAVLGLAWSRARRSRDEVTRLVWIFGVGAWVLALGPWLRVGGFDTHIPLPDIVLAHVPILQDALPQRFTLYLWIATGVVVARWLSASTRTDVRPFLTHVRPFLAFIVAAVTLLPNVFEPGLHGVASVPGYFVDDLWRGTLAPGETVLILHGEKGQEMLWQAATWMGFSMAQGHSGPEPASFRGDPIWGAIREDLPGELDPDAFLAWLHEHHVLAVIADQGSAARWATELRLAIGDTPMRVGGVDVYRVPGSWRDGRSSRRSSGHDRCPRSPPAVADSSTRSPGRRTALRTCAR
jgi:hypothetical protein